MRLKAGLEDTLVLKGGALDQSEDLLPWCQTQVDNGFAGHRRPQGLASCIQLNALKGRLFHCSDR